MKFIIDKLRYLALGFLVYETFRLFYYELTTHKIPLNTFFILLGLDALLILFFWKFVPWMDKIEEEM